MSYPKPLSEKSLARLYEEAGLKEEQIAFLRTFFSACANLYGVIPSEDAWDVYRELSTKAETVLLHRRELYQALGILRREELPFYVFEADEVYSEEKRRDSLRIVAHRSLITHRYGKFHDLYAVQDEATGKPYYVPANLLSFVSPPESPQEKKLRRLLSDLKSTLAEYTDEDGNLHPCPYVGKYLRDFSYISPNDDFALRCLRGEISGCQANPQQAKEFEEKLHSVNAVQYLIDDLKTPRNIGHGIQNASIDAFFASLNAMGVELSAKQTETLLEAVFAMGNNQRLWCNRGWTPEELYPRMRGWGTPVVHFGPGLQKALADGAIDKDEFIRMLREMGLKTE